MSPTSSSSEIDALRALISQSPLYVAVSGPDGLLEAFSPSWRDLIPDTPENAERLKQAFTRDGALIERCLAGDTGTTPPIWIASEDGSERCIALRMGPWRRADGAVGGLMGQCWDVTETETRRRQLERSEQRLNAALSMDRMVVVEIDVKTGEATTSGTCQELIDLMGEHSPDMPHIHPDDREMAYAAGFAAMDSGRPFRIEFRHNSDKLIWLQTVAQTFFDENGEPDHILAVTQDITEHKLRRQAVEDLAYTDPLTGLPNRTRFQQAFLQAAKTADDAGGRLGLIMIDVDHFKEINDTLGHDAGDALLRELGAELRKAFRATDTVARLGGDEFAILLPDALSEEDLVRPLETLRRVFDTPIQYRGQGVRISTSIGAALHSDPDADPEHLLKNADIALYKAKAAGRDRVVVFHPGMRSDMERRLELFRDVRAAIPRGEFILFYQPVVSVSRGAVEGFEALMRWNHPDQGILPPAHFMGAFEDQDLSLQLGEVAIETALRQMRAWMDAGIDFGRMSVNLSAAQFRTGRLAKDILAKLEAWNVPPERLTVEVTENVSMGWGADVVGDTVRELHAKGVTIALDDFGTGYASLANLRQFPIDRLKIDKSFVQNREDDAIVRAVINLGFSMGMEVVAEGVELPEQLNALTRYGCDHVQGYHFAKPMPADEVPQFIAGFGMHRPELDAA